MTRLPTSDATVLRKERAEAMKQLLLIGGKMSNALFLLKQRKWNNTVGDPLIAQATELHEAWDAAKLRLMAAREKP